MKDEVSIRQIGKLFKKERILRDFWRGQKPRLLAREGRPIKFRKISEGRCYICGKYDYVFPLPIIVCEKCIRKLYLSNQTKVERKVNFNKEYCMLCKRPRVFYYVVNGPGCNKCTRMLGRKTNEIRFIKK